MPTNTPWSTLAPLPASLKAISPFVLRAEELKRSDPIMAYWCTYYAAQTGLDLKSHEPGAKDYLLALITRLELMKDELGSNDAVDVEAVGAAYVENFALKVFANADGEDRKGLASRTTAKKFLAAANFLELLQVFERSSNADINEEKIRYAKWKASDIARAMREGRKPTAGSVDDAQVKTPMNEDANKVEPTVSDSPKLSPATLQPTSKRSPPPPPIVIDAPATPTRHHRGNVVDSDDPSGAMSPGNWSTVATPGSTDAGTASLQTFAGRWGNKMNDTPTRKTLASLNVVDELSRTIGGTMNREHSGSTLVDTPTPSGLKPVDTNALGESQVAPPALPKKVHFTPSVIGGLSSISGSPPISPSMTGLSALNSATPAVSPTVDIPRRMEPITAPLPDSPPSSSSLDSSPRKRHGSKLGGSPPRAPPPPPSSSSRRSPPGSSSRSPPSPPHDRAAPPLNSDSLPAPSDPRTQGYQAPSKILPYHSTPAPFQPSYAGSAPSALYDPPVTKYSYSHRYSYSQTHAPPHPPPPSGPKAPSPPLELTATLIAKAQKHCRFAISALEYEDAEQARKELRTALAVLGEGSGL